MEIFRTRQKLIYWIVAILVIPSFILLYGSGVSESMQRGPDPVVMTYRGQSFRHSDIHRFHLKMFAATGAAVRFAKAERSQFMGLDFAPLFPDDLTHAAVALALLQDAKRAGVEVSELEIATHVRAQPLFMDVSDADFDRVLQRSIGNAIPLSTVAEYKDAVRDWLRIGKFLSLLDNTALVTQETAYLVWAEDQTQLTYSRLLVDSATYIAQTRMALEERPAEELESRIEAYLAEHPNDRSYWTKPRWRVEYILIPFDFDTILVSDEEVEAEYQATKLRYLDEAGEPKPLEMVRETVRQTLVRRQGRERAHKRFSEDVEMVLRRAYARAGTEPAPLEDITNALQDKGLRIGTVGSDLPVPTQDVPRAPDLLGANRIPMLLEHINLQYTTPGKSEEDRERDIRPYRRQFRGMESDRAEINPFEGDDGLILLRIAEMVPAEPRKLRDEDGTLDADLHDMILSRLTEIEAMEQARAEALSLMPLMQKGVTSGLERQITTQTVPAGETPRSLREAAVGEVLEPRRVIDGYQVLMLTNRTVPSREAFEAAGSAEESGKQMMMDELTTHSRAFLNRYEPETYMPWGRLSMSERPFTYIIPSDRLLSYLQAALYTEQTLRIHLRPDEDEDS